MSVRRACGRWNRDREALPGLRRGPRCGARALSAVLPALRGGASAVHGPRLDGAELSGFPAQVSVPGGRVG